MRRKVQMDQPSYWSVTQVAEASGWSAATIRRLCEAGLLPCEQLRIGSPYRIHHPAWRDALASLTSETRDERNLRRANARHATRKRVREMRRDAGSAA